MKIDREVYTREFHDAYYRAGTYVAHRIIVEMPTVILATTTFSTILYWSVGLNAVADNFLFFMLVTGTNFITAMLVGFTISSMLPGEVGPAVLLPVFTTLNMLVGGFFIRESTIHSMWIWLYWISFIQWNWSALMVNEFKGTEHVDHCDGNQGNVFTGFLNELPDLLPPASQQLLGIYLGSTNGECEPIQGDVVLSSFGLLDRDRWTSLAWASLSIPAFIATFYLGVRFVRHEKR